MTHPALNLEQLSTMQRCLQRSEDLVSRSFRIPLLPSRQYPYEVATLVELDEAERAAAAFAHLVIYERQRARGPEPLYRICLQDDVILNRLVADRSLGLGELLVYVLTHELVHIVRFQRAEESFHLESPARQREEDVVHQLTLEVLAADREPRWQELSARFGNPVIPALRVVE